MEPYRQPEFSRQAYTADLLTAARAIKTNIDKHGNPRDYLDAKYPQLEQTELYARYRSRLREIGGLALIRSGLDNRQDIRENAATLSDPSFNDGFALGLLTSAELLSTKRQKQTNDITAIEVLSPAVSAVTDRFEAIVRRGGDLDWEVGRHGMFLYASSLAHPDDPHFERLQRPQNPLTILADHVSMRLYVMPVMGASSLVVSDGFGRMNRFKQGFGYARGAYNEYTLAVNRTLDSLFDCTPSTDD